MKDHWKEMCDLFGILAYMVKKTNSDGVDMYLNSTRIKHNDKDVSRLVAILQNHKPQSKGHIDDTCLREVLDRYRATLQAQARLRKGVMAKPYLKPLSVYVLTNARGSKITNVTRPAARVLKTLDELGKPWSQIGIQVVGFANTDESLGSEHNIVDLDSEL
jgi:translation elongation factor EF-4